jgi:hypothetical protein
MSSTELVQEEETANEDDQGNPEVNVGGDRKKKVAGTRAFGQDCRLRIRLSNQACHIRDGRSWSQTINTVRILRTNFNEQEVGAAGDVKQESSFPPERVSTTSLNKWSIQGRLPGTFAVRVQGECSDVQWGHTTTWIGR